mmetsp:Transcript_25387/g.48017  ORF Transcript_25387/g.48017 Transcript_25387/m.48017 type:complete len:222 (-) Transcript_25387:2059-2724(-)
MCSVSLSDAKPPDFFITNLALLATSSPFPNLAANASFTSLIVAVLHTPIVIFIDGSDACLMSTSTNSASFLGASGTAAPRLDLKPGVMVGRPSKRFNSSAFSTRAGPLWVMSPKVLTIFKTPFLSAVKPYFGMMLACTESWSSARAVRKSKLASLPTYFFKRAACFVWYSGCENPSSSSSCSCSSCSLSIICSGLFCFSKGWSSGSSHFDSHPGGTGIPRM